MVYELRKRGLKVETEKPISLLHESVVLDVAYRADLVVEDKVIVELKSVEEVAKVFKKQLKTYLKIADKRLGANRQRIPDHANCARTASAGLTV